MAKCSFLKIPLAAHSDLDECRLPVGKDCPYPEMSCYDTSLVNPYNEDGEPIGVGSREVPEWEES
jgi:hypothetical protein